MALLPILSFALLKFSRHVARFVVRSGFEVGQTPLGWVVLARTLASRQTSVSSLQIAAVINTLCSGLLVQLQGKTDQRFIESSFKLFRDVLNVKTVLTPAQFFEQVRCNAL